MHRQSDTRRLPVKLTPEELEERGHELADAVQEHNEERLDLQSWLDGMKEAKKQKEARVESARQASVRLAAIVQSGEEMREVPADWLYALDAKKAFLVRRDTQELVETIDLRPADLQVEIGEVLQEPTPEQLAAWLGVDLAPADAEEGEEEGEEPVDGSDIPV